MIEDEIFGNFWLFPLDVFLQSLEDTGYVILLGYIRSRLRCRDNMLINHTLLIKKVISKITNWFCLASLLLRQLMCVSISPRLLLRARVEIVHLRLVAGHHSVKEVRLMSQTLFHLLTISYSFVELLLGETDICANWLFCTKFNSKQLLFDAFFEVICIFGSVEPQSESNFSFRTL